MGEIGKGWDEAVRDRFVEELAEGCNVQRAAAIVNRSASSAYRLRARDADFRKRWSEALCIGYARLEMAMLERALCGTEKAIKVGSEIKVVREYDDRLALSLLKMHRESVGEVERGVDESEYEEACERVIAKLARLRERQQSGSVDAANDDQRHDDRDAGGGDAA